MNDEQFDKELSELYQQRKAQIVAPSINSVAKNAPKKYSLFKLLSIFMIGGVSSFGILAIITHFAKSPMVEKPVYSNQHQVDIADEQLKPVDENVLVNIPKLPPQPEMPTLESEITQLAPVKKETKVTDIEHIDVNLTQIVKLPLLNEPEFIIKPVYKVMPKLSTKALQEQQSGIIRMSYGIDESGNVQNIKVISSEVDSDLERSARRALARWKYKPEENIQSNYEIIFEFNFNQK